MTKAFRQVGLVVLVILATSGVWQAAAQVEAKKERPRYEYTVASNPSNSAMSKLGEDGWELVAVDANFAYFKRQK